MALWMISLLWMLTIASVMSIARHINSEIDILPEIVGPIYSEYSPLTALRLILSRSIPEYSPLKRVEDVDDSELPLSLPKSAHFFEEAPATSLPPERVGVASTPIILKSLTGLAILGLDCLARTISPGLDRAPEAVAASADEGFRGLDCNLGLRRSLLERKLMLGTNAGLLLLFPYSVARLGVAVKFPPLSRDVSTGTKCSNIKTPSLKNSITLATLGESEQK